MRRVPFIFRISLRILLVPAIFIFSCKKTSIPDIEQKDAGDIRKETNSSESIPTVIVSSIHDEEIKAKMITSFLSLKTDRSLLSSSLGLTYTLDSSYIDFQNLSKSYIKKAGVTGEAIVAPFKTNAKSNSTNYVFCLTIGPNLAYNCYIIQATTNQLLKYFDLIKGNVLTVNNYNNKSTLSFQAAKGNYIKGPVTGEKKCGQATMDCITDAYSNHGWTSVWATVQSIFVPWTGAAIAGACAAANCG